ncbi:YbaB/EbfC family nucleoid-associated protein [Spongiactinospora sp. TRM90649]|uniref:YbaB/EbfC family nucleoid-associated protein n=1 Tax=Spongiactinospora sp. TRM90649 TaxID=3031114 RepID=UPI0023F93E6E|nr:YbaB/EbfC family nucleoid-associated protein [Spongiactinospora sp. TRM90649]MDF5752611.1 YbaB/EbfC family nucleoid-associated protein [Spongiactinospora sp. TRM90649]
MAYEPVPAAKDPDLTRMMTSLDEQAALFGQVGRDLAETRGTGEAAGGLVTVEVSSSGTLAGVRIEPDALSLGADALAQAVVSAAKLAEQDVAERAHQALGPLRANDGDDNGGTSGNGGGNGVQYGG